MTEKLATAGSWAPGESGNRRGRPKGSKNKKTLLREELEKHGSELATVIKEKALAGDPTCISIWAARLDPPMRARAEAVEFELDASAPLSKQCEQVMQAIADGDLTIEEGKQITDSLRQLAEIRALEGGGSEAERLVELFRQLAQRVDPPGIAYQPRNGVTTQ